MKSYFTVVDGIFTNTNKWEVLLSELNTVVGDGWGWQRDRMMNCTFRFKWGMKIISNTSRSRWWCKHLTSLSLSNDECSLSGPQKRLPTPLPGVGPLKHLQHAMVLSMTCHKRKNRTHGRRTSGKEHLLSCKAKLNFDTSGHSFKILRTHHFIWSTGNSDKFCLLTQDTWLHWTHVCFCVTRLATVQRWRRLYFFNCSSIKIIKQNVIKFSVRSDSWLWTHRHQAWCLWWAWSFLLPWKLQSLKNWVLNVAQTREFQRFFIPRNRKTAFVAVSQKTLYIDFVSRWVHWNFCTWKKKGKLKWKPNPPAAGGDELWLDWWADTTKYLKKRLRCVQKLCLTPFVCHSALVHAGM